MYINRTRVPCTAFISSKYVSLFLTIQQKLSKLLPYIKQITAFVYNSDKMYGLRIFLTQPRIVKTTVKKSANNAGLMYFAPGEYLPPIKMTGINIRALRNICD